MKLSICKLKTIFSNIVFLKTVSKTIWNFPAPDKIPDIELFHTVVSEVTYTCRVEAFQETLLRRITEAY